MACRNCKKSFEGTRLFCSERCSDEYIVKIEERVLKATNEDPSHTKNLSKDE